MIKLELPLKYIVNKKKSINYSLNDFLLPLGSANVFSTYHILKAKRSLIAHVESLCKGLSPIKEQSDLRVELKVFRATNHRSDVDNRVILAKYATDTLVKCGIVEDDGFKFIREITIVDCGLDENNPRCEYYIGRDEEFLW